MLAAAAVLSGCGSGGGAPSPSPSPSAVASSASPVAVSDNTWTDATDPTKILLGDGNVATQPKQGNVFSCVTAFGGGGAQRAGPWIDPVTQTWNQRTKPVVQGSDREAAAQYSESVQGSTRTVNGNDLPLTATVGTFPIASSDPGYQYDRNPNVVSPQSFKFALPLNPAAGAAPFCVGLGAIGVTRAGVLLYDALDAAGRDAGAHELQDTCGGHPDMRGAYHYHAIAACLLSPGPSSSQLIGYALDGYGIYAEWNAAGALPTDNDLDACHGRTSTVPWNGTAQSVYHYDVTLEYPYTVGCFHGSPVQSRP